MGSAKTVFVTDADNREILEYDGTSGAVKAWYTYGLGSNEVLTRTDVAAGTRRTMIPDILGSIIGTVDSGTGAVTKTGYQAFGENPALASGNFNYTAQRFDPETAGSAGEPSGLYYYRARMYSPVLGRFLQPDPIGYQGGANLYTYVGNDPLNLVDPTGNGPYDTSSGQPVPDASHWETGDRSVYGGGPPKYVKLPADVSVTVGAGPAAVVQINRDGSVYTGAGAGVSLKGKATIKIPDRWSASPEAGSTRELTSFQLGKDPIGPTIAIDVGAGLGFGLDAQIYVNGSGISGSISAGYVEGAGGTITAGNRWKPNQSSSSLPSPSAGTPK